MKRKHYSKEFKEEACRMVLYSFKKHSDVAQELNIDKTMLYRWIREYVTLGSEAFVGQGNIADKEAQIKKLYRENRRLRLENEILKKEIENT